MQKDQYEQLHQSRQKPFWETDKVMQFFHMPSSIIVTDVDI